MFQEGDPLAPVGSDAILGSSVRGLSVPGGVSLDITTGTLDVADNITVTAGDVHLRTTAGNITMLVSDITGSPLIADSRVLVRELSAPTSTITYSPAAGSGIR